MRRFHRALRVVLVPVAVLSILATTSVGPASAAPSKNTPTTQSRPTAPSGQTTYSMNW